MNVVPTLTGSQCRVPNVIDDSIVEYKSIGSI